MSIGDKRWQPRALTESSRALSPAHSTRPQLHASITCFASGGDTVRVKGPRGGGGEALKGMVVPWRHRTVLL